MYVENLQIVFSFAATGTNYYINILIPTDVTYNMAIHITCHVIYFNLLNFLFSYQLFYFNL